MTTISTERSRVSHALHVPGSKPRKKLSGRRWVSRFRGSTSTAGLLLSVAMSSHAAGIGVVSVYKRNEIQVHTLTRLNSDDKVRIQYLDSKGVTRCCKKFEGRSFVAVAAANNASDSLTGESLFSYRLRAPTRWLSPQLFVGAALIGGRELKSVGPASLQFDSDKGPWLVETCISPEGFHVTAKADQKVLEDVYWGFDYSVEHPTCR